ncbi:3-phosphoserine/phosphohydroxythreonine transaminase [Aliikangiella marina]|uniref:Phosphoserine aminotransferase n=1 Tax=Aliikangiella marina TaxID=1712262 RepID=A0A545TI45_9GAMM|nr:3-phosphoserine/phosphohydroxythreonine transaminase [Aliikangiella marina]TQV76882.1 3-phosphoserine/phosphohydroxythreonine transaminase [Aliikangiella marina]
MTNPTYNFCAGPAALPKAVMEKAQQELLNWRNLGISVMEISHRSAEYQALATTAEANLRKLLNISDDYAILFLHGGATLQFSNIPMSLLNATNEAEYLSNGMWSGKAAKEARRYGNVNEIEIVATDSEGRRFVTDSGSWSRSDNPAYTHYTPNETIEGIRIGGKLPANSPVIADMSSCILSENIDVNDYAMIYAGAQKNIGPAGMTIVIVKKAFFEQMNFSQVPRVFNYQEQAKQGSMINTPPTYTWYLASLVFEWLLEQGGVAEMEQRAIARAEKLYSYIDADDFYSNPIAIKNRSRMNIPFILADNGLDGLFLEKAQAANLVGLKGHRSVGGMRASLYNSMPLEGVDALIEFMADFKRKYA